VDCRYLRRSNVQDLSKKFTKLLSTLPVIDLDKAVLGRENPYWRKWIEHPTDDSYWEPADFLDKLTHLNIPVFHRSGWFDGDGIGTKLNYLRMADHQADQKLTLGPWGHTDCQRFCDGPQTSGCRVRLIPLRLSRRSRLSTTIKTTPRTCCCRYFQKTGCDGRPYGEALLKAGQVERAARQFLAAATVLRVEISIATIAHLRGAQAFDLASRRREALAQYEIVMKRSNVYHSRERPAQGLQKSYRE
jgi:hypothetical protein